MKKAGIGLLILSVPLLIPFYSWMLGANISWYTGERAVIGAMLGLFGTVVGFLMLELP